MDPDSPLTFFTSILNSTTGILQAHSRISAKFNEDISAYAPGTPVESTFIGQCL